MNSLHDIGIKYVHFLGILSILSCMHTEANQIEKVKSFKHLGLLKCRQRRLICRCANVVNENRYGCCKCQSKSILDICVVQDPRHATMLHQEDYRCIFGYQNISQSPVPCTKIQTGITCVSVDSALRKPTSHR